MLFRSRGPSATDHLPAIAQAVWGERRLAMRYESWKGEVSRRVDPLGLVLKAGIWYLAARVGMGVRTYRLSSILDLEVTEEPFERPSDFDLAAWWQASTQRFEKELAVGTATLRVSPSGLKAVRELGAAVARAAEASASEPDEAGWRRVTIPIESIAHAAAQALRLGAQAEVLEPAALRRELVDRVAAMAAIYAQG